MPGSFGGRVAWRLEVEGLGIEAVTDASMHQTTIDGRIRRTGLKRSSLRIEDKSKPHKGVVESLSMTFEIVEQPISKVWVSWLYHQPSLRTWLTANFDDTDAVCDVASTTGFSNGDVIHVGTEAIKVNVSTSTRFAVTTRGYWGTEAQSHFVGNGANLSTPAVSLDRPMSLEGRRCNLYMYGPGEDRQGDGTQVWRGTINEGPKLSGGGTKWILSAKSLAASIFNRDLGSDLEAGTAPRGAFYPTGENRFEVDCFETSTTRYGSDDGTSRETITLAGHFETQQDFCDALNTELAALTIFTGQSGPTAVVDDTTGGWRVDYVAHASSPKWFRMDTKLGARAIDGEVSPLADARAAIIGNGQAVSLHAGTFDMGGPNGVITGQGKIPRGIFASGRQYEVASTADNVSPYTIFPAQEVTVAVGDSAVIKWPDGAEGEYTVDGVSTSENYIRFRPLNWLSNGGAEGEHPAYVYSPWQTPQIEFRKTYLNNGNFSEFLDKLIDDSSTEANKGAMPRMTANDIQQSGLLATLQSQSRGIRFLMERKYIGSQAVELSELVEHECKLLSIFPAMAADGRIYFVPFRLPGSTSLADVTLTVRNTLTDDNRPSVERDGYGSLNMATIKTAYSHIDDEHKGRTYSVRDVYAVSIRPQGKDLRIEPRSRTEGDDVLFNAGLAKEITANTLGILGRPYSLLTIEVPLYNHDGTNLLTACIVGNIAAITAPHVPDSQTGTYGITERRGLIIGRNWDLARGRGVLTLMLRDEPVAGYAPEVTVLLDAVVSGNQYDLTVTFTDPEGLFSTAPSGAALSSFFEPGMTLQLMDWDSSTVTPQDCTVDTVTDVGSILRVTFGSAPTISGTQYLRFRDDAAATVDQEPYGFYADDSARLAFPSGAAAAKVFAG